MWVTVDDQSFFSLEPRHNLSYRSLAPADPLLRPVHHDINVLQVREPHTVCQHVVERAEPERLRAAQVRRGADGEQADADAVYAWRKRREERDAHVGERVAHDGVGAVPTTIMAKERSLVHLERFSLCQ